MTTLQKPLRLWPGIAAVTLQWILWLVLPLILPDALLYSVFGAVALGPVVLMWWIFFSRAPWLERVCAVVLMVAAVAATPRFLDKSIATGMMGMMFFILVIPVLCLALVLWAVATRKLSGILRPVTMAAALLAACAVFTLIRTNGMKADASSDLAWRWAPTAEDRLLVHASDKPAAAAPAPAPAAIRMEPKAVVAPVVVPPKPKMNTTADWPGFRGPHRDGVAHGVQIATDWVQSKPKELWHRPVGPGWSSFAVRGGLIYTQEQRGAEEVVACYDLATGDPVWTHRDKARFWESNAGAGPRATPTLANGRVYTFGATGIVNALDAGTGAVKWSRNAGTDAGVKVPEWGFASSPLVAGHLVIVAAAGKLVAYDPSTGEPRWMGPDGGISYSSPVPTTIDGIEQVLLVSTAGASGVALTDGTELWKHAWPGYPIVQPGLTAEGDILISVSDSSGLRRLAITHAATGWSAAERWTSPGLKPYFNDFVVHNGYAYGFDGAILSCIDLKDGKRIWKGGRYGHGQMLLLADQNVLLVLSEEGEVALVSASPEKFTELAKMPALEGKTWNHPVLAGDVLLVRNDQQMAAFHLSASHL